jgi:hypothetical protein
LKLRSIKKPLILGLFAGINFENYGLSKLPIDFG